MLRRLQKQQEARKQKKAMAERLQPTGRFVYLLTEESTNHNGEDEAQTIGIYDSKEAALFAAGLVETSWGNIDEAKEQLKKDKSFRGYQDAIEDNREDSPEEGVIWKFGNGDIFEGDTQTVCLEKISVLGLAVEGEKKRKKRKKNNSA